MGILPIRHELRASEKRRFDVGEELKDGGREAVEEAN